MEVGGETHTVSYVPGESNTYVFGGNSNWRGPIWLCGKKTHTHTHSLSLSHTHSLSLTHSLTSKFLSLSLTHTHTHTLSLTHSLVNFLIIETLERYFYFYGDDLKVECPTGSGVKKNLLEVSQEICRR